MFFFHCKGRFEYRLHKSGLSIFFFDLNPALAYGTYFMMVLSRLELSFKDTLWALSPRSLYVLRMFVLVVPLVTTLTLAVDRGDHVCITTWTAPDLAHDLTFCQLDPEEMLLFRYYVVFLCVLWVNAFNILFAVLFTVKLKKILKMTQSSASQTEYERLVKLQRLILRNDILTIVGSTSTFLGLYIPWKHSLF